MAQNLNIYYAGAMSQATDEDRNKTKKIIQVLKKHGKVLSEHILSQSQEDRQREKERGITVFERDLSLLNLSDVAVAEVSQASTGTGMEIMYSSSVRNIPTLCVYKQGSPASRLVLDAVSPRISHCKYSTLEGLEHQIQDWFKTIEPPAPTFSKFLTYDGIDGSGKSEIGRAIHQWAKDSSLSHWGLWGGSSNTQLSWDELKAAGTNPDVLFIQEPPHEDIGFQVRSELIKDNNRDYSPEGIADGYALARGVLFNKLAIPALQEGKIVVSDRGVVTSLIYQAVYAQTQGYSKEAFRGYILGRPENQLALAHSPGLIIFTDVEAKEAMRRLDKRSDKDDDCIWEVEDFQSKLAKEYRHSWIRNFYANRGTTITSIVQEKGSTPQDTTKRAREIWENYLKEKGISL